MREAREREEVSVYITLHNSWSCHRRERRIMVPYWSWPPLSMVRRRQPTWIRRMTITTAAWHWTRRRRRRRPMFRIHAPCLRHIASRCLFTQCGYIPAYCRRQIHGCPRCCPLSAKLHAHTLYRGEQSLLSFSTPSNRIVLLSSQRNYAFTFRDN